MAELSTKYMGLTLRNPIIVASSGLTDSFSKIQEHDRNGAGAVVLKSLFEEQIMLEAQHKLEKARKNTFIYSEHSETLDYIDLHIKERELGNYLNLIAQVKRDLSIPVIASINCISSAEWTGFAKQIQQAGADALELNIFLMPFHFENNANEIQEKYYEIVRKIKKEITIPVSVKISPYFSNLGQVVMSLEVEGADAVVLFNRFSSPNIDIDNIKITVADVFSTPAEMYNSLRWIAMLSQRVDIDLAASTGVHDGEAVIKQILAGASAVQVASALYKNGNDYLPKMLNTIHNWMEKKGFNYIDQFKAKLSQDKASNPEVYERLQFMKYFSEIS